LHLNVVMGWFSSLSSTQRRWWNRKEEKNGKLEIDQGLVVLEETEPADARIESHAPKRQEIRGGADEGRQKHWTRDNTKVTSITDLEHSDEAHNVDWAEPGNLAYSSLSPLLILDATDVVCNYFTKADCSQLIQRHCYEADSTEDSLIICRSSQTNWANHQYVSVGIGQIRSGADENQPNSIHARQSGYVLFNWFDKRPNPRRVDAFANLEIILF
jgi:hypothetical protein